MSSVYLFTQRSNRPVTLAATEIIDDLHQAAEALRAGLLVAFATETVYGLGADATNPRAIERLFAAKGRPGDNPLIVHLASPRDWRLAARRLSSHARTLLEAFSPGPLTVVVEKCPAIVDAVTAGLPSVGIRIPDHAQARQLLELCRLPIAAPSANRSGRPSCTRWQSVLEDLDGQVDYILRGPPCQVGIESTVVDCTGPEPVMLRAGAITLGQLRGLIPGTRTWNSQATPAATASPGLRHPHYQPRATVHLVGSESELAAWPVDQLRQSVYAGLDEQPLERVSADRPDPPLLLLRRFATVEQYMREFYEVLREADRRGATGVFLQIAETGEAGDALRDRQLRAAGQLPHSTEPPRAGCSPT